MQGSRWVFIVLGLVILIAAGCRYPKDMEGTLNGVKGGVLDVGVTENPPWVIHDNSSQNKPPRGVEADIVRDIARGLDAEIRWHWASESELIPALKQFQLDLVIGGLVDGKRLKNEVALTKPYFKSRHSVGFPGRDGQAPPASLKDLEIYVPAVNRMAEPLRSEDAIPVRYADQPPENQPLAGATWWLRARGLQPGPWTLHTDRHVMALPNGENAWIAHVQKHLNGIADMERRLRGAVGESADQGGNQQ